MFKKLFFLSLMMATACAAQAPVVEDYSTGKAKIVAIMSDDQQGVVAYNQKNIKPIETQSISQDLNIPEVARSLGCKTLIGELYLIETLQYPISKLDTSSVLQHRQNIIRALVENPELRAAVHQALETAKDAESDVCVLMSDSFKGRTCPELASLELVKKDNPGLYRFVNFLNTNVTAATIAKMSQLGGLAATAFGTYFFGKVSYDLSRLGLNYTYYNGEILHDTPLVGLNYVASGVYALYLGAVSGFGMYGVGKDYVNALEKRRKVHALNRLVDAAEKIEVLYKQYGLESQFKISAISDDSGKTLIKKLKHPRYQSKKGYIFMLPSVHSFLYEIYQNDRQLAQLFACVAEMDAYYAIANKMVENQNSHNHFCFAQFSDEKSGIRSEGFWNLLVKNAVPSSIDEQKHIILTGPNAGGKTTTIRALLQNIVLAQTFGIAAARSWSMPFVDVVHSYLNISDDILAGKSLFASEVKRAQDVLQRIKTLEPDCRYFFVLDELFTGTAAEAGEECAYEFIKRISEFPNVQFIYATHFNKLKELGSDSLVCANYKVDAPTKNDEGKLVYPFTLSTGASDVNVALDLAKEAQLFA